MAEYMNKDNVYAYLCNNMMWYDEDGNMADDEEKDNAILDLVNGIPTADVIERSKIDKAIDEIDFLRQHRAKYITEDNKICIDSGEVLKILKNIGE